MECYLTEAGLEEIKQLLYCHYMALMLLDLEHPVSKQTNKIINH